MRTRLRIGLAAVLLLAAAASGAIGKDLVDRVLGVADAPRLKGFLTWQHLRSTVPGGCELAEQRQAAAGVYVVEQQVKRQLARLLTPRPAHAARPAACVALLIDGAPNLIVNAGEAFLVDAWQNTVELEIMRYHGAGTGTTAAAEGDTALQTESTTVLNPNDTRATGSLTEASASVFRTVGTLTFDGTAAITEWGLHSQSGIPGGTLFSRIVFSAINVANGDSIQFTYDLTVESVLAGYLWLMVLMFFVPTRRQLRRLAPVAAALLAVGVWTAVASAEGAITTTARCALEWNAPTTNADGTPLVDLAGYGVYIADTPAALAALTAPTAFVPSPALNPTAGTKATWPCHSTATLPGRPLPVGQKYSQVDAVDQVGNRSARTAVVPFELRDGVPPSTPTGLAVVPPAGP